MKTSEYPPPHTHLGVKPQIFHTNQHLKEFMDESRMAN